MFALDLSTSQAWIWSIQDYDPTESLHVLDKFRQLKLIKFFYEGIYLNETNANLVYSDPETSTQCNLIQHVQR